EGGARPAARESAARRVPVVALEEELGRKVEGGRGGGEERSPRRHHDVVAEVERRRVEVLVADVVDVDGTWRPGAPRAQEDRVAVDLGPRDAGVDLDRAPVVLASIVL